MISVTYSTCLVCKISDLGTFNFLVYQGIGLNKFPDLLKVTLYTIGFSLQG